MTVDNDNVRKGRKHVHGSKMWKPLGLFSINFQHVLRLIPWLSRPRKLKLQIPSTAF